MCSNKAKVREWEPFISELSLSVLPFKTATNIKLRSRTELKYIRPRNLIEPECDGPRNHENLL